MPLYTYLNLTTGKHEVIMRRIAERDTLAGFERIFETCQLPPPACIGPRLSTQAQQVLDGYRKLEASGEIKKSRSEATEIRDTWRDVTADRAASEEKADIEKETIKAEQSAN